MLSVIYWELADTINDRMRGTRIVRPARRFSMIFDLSTSEYKEVSRQMWRQSWITEFTWEYKVVVNKVLNCKFDLKEKSCRNRWCSKADGIPTITESSPRDCNKIQVQITAKSVGRMCCFILRDPFGLQLGGLHYSTLFLTTKLLWELIHGSK